MYQRIQASMFGAAHRARAGIRARAAAEFAQAPHIAMPVTSKGTEGCQQLWQRQESLSDSSSAEDV
jgi:hypothetical protein